MDLYTVEAYLKPQSLQEINWQPGYALLAGGTWIFNEPQPHINTLVDMQQLGWAELEIAKRGLGIGAMCLQNTLLDFSFPQDWTAAELLKDAVRELASFKLSNEATVGGNICLALSASTFAPVTVALNASYEIWSLQGEPRIVKALDFQQAPQRTILQPGEVLRKIWIPAENLTGWQTSFKRMAVSTAGYAIATVASAYNEATQQLRFGIAGSVMAPCLIEFASPPNETELAIALDAQIPSQHYLNNDRASADYRRHITQFLMQRTLTDLTTGAQTSRRF
ncbi:FAD binding domain-containing protein [Oscillatoria sp. CS-180]|uniref:FAD binding domain-containing protein n=1 Tax=Oscillatoria sp. CS-180 TaxID=3021720 RepID=UPI00232EA4C0|nr:FAD binding domain-containing protein [Oscillatoria sp. CS-180]MDB9525820.1 FAD binding domain-containing protein [Oscillatoria sp. CS-180]